MTPVSFDFPKTYRSDGRSTFRLITLEQLKVIERNYGVFLNTDGSDRSRVVVARSY